MSEVFNIILELILMAQGQSSDLPPPPGFAEVFAKMAPMFLVVFMIFYFMVIKPQQQKLRQQQSLLDSLKKGDQIVTSGGIIARVSGLEDNFVMLDIASNVKLKVEREHVVKKVEDKVAEK